MPKLSAKRKGDISELQVTTYYLEKGYDVFRNVSSTGIIDLVVFCPKTKNFFLCDVKTMTQYKREDDIINIHTNATTEEQRKVGIEVVALYQGKLYKDPIRIKEKFKDESKTVS